MIEQGRVDPTVESIARVFKQIDKEPLTPQLLTSYWQAFWFTKGPRAEGGPLKSAVHVPPLDCTQERLDGIVRSGRRVVYVPDSGNIMNLLHTAYGYASYGREDHMAAVNREHIGGYYATEESSTAPYKGWFYEDVARDLNRQGRQLITLPVLVVASYENARVTGKFYDQTDTSRADSSGHYSRIRSFVDNPPMWKMWAGFNHLGDLVTNGTRWLPAHAPQIGARSQERILTQAEEQAELEREEARRTKLASLSKTQIAVLVVAKLFGREIDIDYF